MTDVWRARLDEQREAWLRKVRSESERADAAELEVARLSGALRNITNTDEVAHARQLARLALGGRSPDGSARESASPREADDTKV